MTDPIDRVRRVMAEPEDIDMGGVPPAAPEDDGDDPPPPPVPEDASPVQRAAAEPLNDVGNGRRFIIHFGEDFRWVPTLKWYAWAGTHWQRDEYDLAVRRMGQKLHPLIEEETAFLQPRADQLPFAEERERLRSQYRALAQQASRAAEDDAAMAAIPARIAALDKHLDGFDKSVARRRTHAKDTGNSGRIDKFLVEAHVSLSVPFDQLDADPMAVNCLNGLLRFSVSQPSGQGDTPVARVVIEPHSRDQLVTKIVPIVYDPDAKAPLWDAFLRRIQPEKDKRDFLQRHFGLSMTALKSSHMAFLYGSGANGKSVLVDTIARVLSSYAAMLKIESITGTNKRGGADATPDLMPLLGSRFVRTSEPDQGMPLQESLVKQMTGGEPIQVRPMYGQQIDVTPTWKITMSGNHKPDIRGTDDGIWRRVMLVPFDVQIPREERDERFGERLWAERAGILTWLVDGLLSYLEMGLAPPASVREATEDYREESDPLGRFLMTRCVITGDQADAIPAARMVKAVHLFLSENGLSVWRDTTISRGMSEKARTFRHPETGKRFSKSKASSMQYIGIRLTDAFARAVDAAGDHGGIVSEPHTPSVDF